MASDGLRIELIARDFNRMLEELSEIDPKVEFRDVVIGMAERVTRGAARFTEAADLQRMKANFNSKEYTTFNGKRYKITNRYPDHLWAEIERFRGERFEARAAARGLAKQSFAHVAASFAASANVPAFVTNANYKGRQFPSDGASSETGSGTDYALTIINYSPIVQAAGGQRALLRAMQGETRYFQVNMEKRAFRTLESRVAKYPQVFARHAG